MSAEHGHRPLLPEPEKVRTTLHQVLDAVADAVAAKLVDATGPDAREGGESRSPFSPAPTLHSGKNSATGRR